MNVFFCKKVVGLGIISNPWFNNHIHLHVRLDAPNAFQNATSAHPSQSHTKNLSFTIAWIFSKLYHCLHWIRQKMSPPSLCSQYWNNYAIAYSWRDRYPNYLEWETDIPIYEVHYCKSSSMINDSFPLPSMFMIIIPIVHQMHPIVHQMHRTAWKQKLFWPFVWREVSWCWQ